MPSRRAAFRGRVRAAPNSAGRFLETWGGFGAGDGQFDTPTGIAVNATGTVYVADSFSARIQRFNSTGTFLGKWGSFGAGDGQFNNPIAIAIDSTGDAWVADSNEGRIQEFSATGAVLLAIIGDDVLSGALFTPRGLAVDAADNVYVTDLGKDRVLLYDEYGAYISQWGDEFGGSARGQLPNPEGITADGAGDVLVVANALTEVKRFDPTMQELEGERPTIRFRDTSTGILGAEFPWDLTADVATGRFSVKPPFGGEAFVVESSAGANTLVVDSAERVGIGTDAPDAPVDVVTSGNVGLGNSMLLLRRTGGPLAFQLQDDDTGDFWNITMSDGAGEFRFSRNGTGQREMTLDAGGNMTITGTLTQNSDAARKRHLEPVDASGVLDAVASLPMYTWSYDHSPGVTHLGPTAQDFSAAFGLGASPTGIASVDADGVALAAIQALVESNQVKDARIAELEAALASLAKRVDALEG